MAALILADATGIVGLVIADVIKEPVARTAHATAIEAAGSVLTYHHGTYEVATIAIPATFLFFLAPLTLLAHALGHTELLLGNVAGVSTLLLDTVLQKALGLIARVAPLLHTPVHAFVAIAALLLLTGVLAPAHALIADYVIGLLLSAVVHELLDLVLADILALALAQALRVTRHFLALLDHLALLLARRGFLALLRDTTDLLYDLVALTTVTET